MKKTTTLRAKYKRLAFGGATSDQDDAEEAVIGTGASGVKSANWSPNAGFYGMAATFGNGIIDAVAPPDDFGYQGGVATVGKSALSGAAAGATVGSVIPGLGTGIGAAAGAVVGAGVGLIKNKQERKHEDEARKKFNTDNLRYQQAVSSSIAQDPDAITGHRGATFYRNGGILDHDNFSDMSTPFYLKYKKMLHGGTAEWDDYQNAPEKKYAFGGETGGTTPKKTVPLASAKSGVDYVTGKIITSTPSQIQVNPHYVPKMNDAGQVFSNDGQRVLGYMSPGNFSVNGHNSGLPPADLAFLHMMSVDPNSNPTLNSWNNATYGKGNIKMGRLMEDQTTGVHAMGGAMGGAPLAQGFKDTPERAPKAGAGTSTGTPIGGNTGLAKYTMTRSPIRRMRNGFAASAVARQQNPIYATGGMMAPKPGTTLLKGKLGRPDEPGAHPYIMKLGALETGGRIYNEGAVEHFAQNAHGGPMIKPSHKGRFTAWAKGHGMSVGAATSKVLAHKDSYSGGVVKMANFARNFGGHATGGSMDSSAGPGNPGAPMMESYYWTVKGRPYAAGGNMLNNIMGKGTAYDLGTDGVRDNPLTRHFMSGGVATPLSSDNTQFNGDSHEEGGIKIPALGAETEGGETTKDNYVFSKDLGFAALHKPIALAKGKIEKKPQTPDRVNALQRLNAREAKLAMAQEMMKAQMGIK
jgi:Glycine zipper